MACLQRMELDLDLEDGFTIPLCARYAGQGTEVLRECKWCCFNDENN
jgi:hypothetical protein